MKTVAIIIGVVVVLLCIIVFGVATFVDISMGRQLSKARKQRRFLEKYTARAQVRSLTGTVVGRKIMHGSYYVIVAIGQRTELDFEDEDAYWTLKRNEKVDVYVREHYDSDNTLIARFPVGIDFYD